jgi:hypothetical protein
MAEELDLKKLVSVSYLALGQASTKIESLSLSV